MTVLLVMLALALAGSDAAPGLHLTQEDRQEKPKVPKDSIELTVIGCLKGRVLTTIDERQADVESGPHVGERTFRLAGKRDVMNEVTRHDGHLVEVLGIVKRSALDEKGIKVGRVTIAGGSPAAARPGIPTGADNVAVMDTTAVRLRSTSCTGR
jgi:hypothetical protein